MTNVRWNPNEAMKKNPPNWHRPFKKKKREVPDAVMRSGMRSNRASPLAMACACFGHGTPMIVLGHPPICPCVWLYGLSDGLFGSIAVV
jgi:hypothetical protein